MEKAKYEVPRIEDMDSRLLFRGDQVGMGGEGSGGMGVIDPGKDW